MYGLSRRFRYHLLEITSDEDAFLSSVIQRMKNAAAVGRGGTFLDIVLVHWPSPHAAFNGVKNWLSLLEGHNLFLSQPGAAEINFSIGRLEEFASPLQDTLRFVEDYSRGGVSCRD